MLLGIRWSSLYAKIIAWSFVPTVVILVTVALVTFYSYEQVTENFVIARDQELVRLSASQLTAELTEHTNLLSSAARLLTVSNSRQQNLKQGSNRLVIFDGGVVVLDNFGIVVAAEPERRDIIGQNWSDRAYFRQMARAPRPTFSDIVADGPQGIEVIALAVPITSDRGEFLGAVVGMFRLGARTVSAFYGGIVKLRLAENGNTYLVDSAGRVIYHSDVNRIGDDFSTQPVIQEALQGKVGSIRTSNVTGRDTVAGYAPVPGTPWTLVTEESWAALTSAGQGYRTFLLILLALGIIIPAVVVTVGVRRIIKPIEDLTEAAQEVARGNFGQRIIAHTGDEIEKLAGQFNLMAAQIQGSYSTLEQRVATRTNELATLTKQFAILNAISASVNESLDLSDTLDRVLDETLGLLNVEVGEIRLWDEECDELILRTQRGLSPEFTRLAERQSVITLLPNPASSNPVIVEDLLASDVYPLARQEGLTALAIFPFRARERLLGTLCLATRRGPRAVARNERELLRSASDQAAVAIENAQLYAETRRRVDEIETLFAVQQAITSRLDSQAVLQLIADEARRLTSARGAFVFMLEQDELCLSVISGEDVFDIGVGYRLPVGQSVTGLAIESSQPLRIADAEQEPRANKDLVQRLQARSLLIMPLVSGTKTIGSISVINKTSGPFTGDDERVMGMLASGAVIGLENARLYQEEQERRYEAEQRRQVAEGLRDILTVLNSSRPLNEILDYIVAQASRLLGSDAVALFRLQDKNGPLKLQAAQGLPAEYGIVEIPLGEGVVGRVVQQFQPLAVSDITQISPVETENLRQNPQQWALLVDVMARFHAMLGVPLVVKDEVYGGIMLYYSQPRLFSEEEIGLAVSFADQVALAIENARLFDQAEQAAILEERQRLARELHDSVTQALYGVTMFAEAAARLLAAGKVELATDHLNELRGTAQEALQEMRLLLFELRPPVLEEEGLIAALQIRLEAVERRSGLATELKVAGDEELLLPPKIEDGLYRIAQEALNNALKHAQAQRISICLSLDPRQVALEIADDGRGFDPATVRERAGMGLRGMEERVAQLGAYLTIDSQPGQGTKIKVEVRP
ncbi:MAG: GAF domain-containing protein [Anaerolineales bacterium]|nr:GAF domain-containing protein [Anaerolineales bacterium]